MVEILKVLDFGGDLWKNLEKSGKIWKNLGQLRRGKTSEGTPWVVSPRWRALGFPHQIYVAPLSSFSSTTSIPLLVSLPLALI